MVSLRLRVFPRGAPCVTVPVMVDGCDHARPRAGGEVWVGSVMAGCHHRAWPGAGGEVWVVGCHHHAWPGDPCPAGGRQETR
jgi:transposase